MKRFGLALGAILAPVCFVLVLFSFPSAIDARTVVTASLTPPPTSTPQPTAAPPTVVPTLNPCDIAPPAPPLITPAKGAIIRTTTFVLKWQKVACKPTYRLEIRRDSKTGRILIDNTFKRKAFIATLEGGRQYVWRVTACTDKGCRSTAWRKFSIILQPPPTWTPAAPATTAPQPTLTPPPPPPTANPYAFGFVRSTCEHAVGTFVHILVFSNYKDPSSQLAGARVIASYGPDSPAFGDVVGVTNQQGEYVYTMSDVGNPPYLGDVYAWVVDSNNNRISPVAGPVTLNGKGPDEPDTCWIAKFYFAGGAP